MSVIDNLYLDDVSVRAQANQAQQQRTQTITVKEDYAANIPEYIREKMGDASLQTHEKFEQERQKQQMHYANKGTPITDEEPNILEPSNVFVTQTDLMTGTKLNPGVEVPDLRKQAWQESLKKEDTTTVFAQAVWQSSPWGILDKGDDIKASDLKNSTARKAYYLGSILGEASDVSLWTLIGFGTGKVIATSTRATNIISKLGGSSKVAQATKGILKGLFIGGEAGKALIKHKQGYNPVEIAIDIGGDIAAFKGFEYGVKKGAGIETGKKRAFLEIEQKSYTPIVGSGEQSRTTTLKIGVKEVKGKNIKIKGVGIGETRTSSDTSVFVGKFAAVGESEKDLTALKEASHIHGLGTSGRSSIFEQGESIIKYSDDAAGVAYKATRYIKQGNTITADVVRSAEVVNKEKRFLKIFRGFMDVIKPSNGDVTRYAVVGVGGGKTGATAVVSTTTETTQLGRDILASMRYSGTGFEIPLPSESLGIGSAVIIPSVIEKKTQKNGKPPNAPKINIFGGFEGATSQKLLQVQVQENKIKPTPTMTYKQGLEQQVWKELKPEQKPEQSAKPQQGEQYYPHPTPKPKPEPKPEAEAQAEEQTPMTTTPPGFKPLEQVQEQEPKLSPSLASALLPLSAKPSISKPITKIMPPIPFRLRFSPKYGRSSGGVSVTKRWSRKNKWGDIRFSLDSLKKSLTGAELSLKINPMREKPKPLSKRERKARKRKKKLKRKVKMARVAPKKKGGRRK